jgi:hypothetical protein
LEPSTNSDSEEESKEVESEYEDDSVFVIEPCDAAVTGIMKGLGASFSAPEARKHAVDGGMAQEEEAKQARVEQRLETASAADPPSGKEEAIVGSLTAGSSHGVLQTGQGSAEPVPTSTDVLGLGSRLPLGI